MKEGDIIKNEYDSILMTIQKIEGDNVTLFFHDLESLENEFFDNASEFYLQTEVVTKEQLAFAYSKETK